VDARDLLDRRARRLDARHVRLESRGDHLVGDRHETIGAFRMIRAHFVLQARGVRDEDGAGHDGCPRRAPPIGSGVPLPAV
jgi:hypothetical protein